MEIIDDGSQLNLLSARHTKELSLKVEPLPKIVAEVANKLNIIIYKVIMA